MPEAKTLNERDSKLVSWLSEAHGKEAELEADLTAHIALTEKMAYKKRLRTHLTETRDHKRRVAQRIKQLGGPTGQGLISATTSAAGSVAGKTVAAVKGQVGAARALVTEQAETHLRNAQEELREEHVEIALYTRIEVLATEVGDRETAQLARSIRRDEERMAKFLTAELGRLVKDVVRAEIPRDQRGGTSRSRSSRSTSRSSRTTSRTRSRSGTSRASASRSGTSRSSTSRASASRSGTSRSGTSRASASRSSSSGTSRSGTSRSGTSRSTSGSRSTGSTRSNGSRSSGSTRSNGSRSSGSTRSRARAGARS